jgi:RNA-directed DNA polymerase
MRESHDEGLASHIGPKSCVQPRKVLGEALIGVRTGQELNREMEIPPRGGHFGVPTLVRASGRLYGPRRYREMRPDPARSETLCMSGTISSGTVRASACLRANGAQTASGSPRTSRR